MRLEAENGVLVVIVQERPTISQIDIIGTKEFDKDTLKKALKDIGVAESRIFDRSALDRAEQEFKRQYINRGYYGVKVTTTVTPQERNRVAINFTVEEGDVAKIANINIVGTQAFPEKTLIREMQLSTPGWLTWYTKNDQYSKQKLQADLETLRSYYTNRGYLEFAVDSTQVSITPDKEDIYITINITEGPKYTVSDVQLAGELLLPEAELMRLVQVRPGDVYSREKLTQSTKAISDRWAATATRSPTSTRCPRSTATSGRRDSPSSSIRAAACTSGASTSAATRKTRDEVIRREMRQLEGALVRRDAHRALQGPHHAAATTSRTSTSRRRRFRAARTRSISNVTVTEKSTGNLLAASAIRAPTASSCRDRSRRTTCSAPATR